MAEKRISGYRRRQLVNDLAQGDLDNEALAEKYDVEVVSIVGFAKRNAEEVNEVKAESSEELSTYGMWAVQKALRIAEYQQIIEDINEVLERLPEPNAGLIKMKMDALKSVAEELGQLPTKAQLQVEMKQVRYLLEGVDPKDDV